MRTFSERFADYFGELGNAEQVAIFNEWASETGNEQIYQIEDFDDIMSGFKPLGVACMVRYGDFNPHCPAFTFNGYGNLESIENVAEWLEDYVDEMAGWYEDRAASLTRFDRDALALYEDEDEEPEEEE